MADTLITVGLEIRNDKARDEIRDTVASLQGFYVQKPSDTGDCDILILEIGEDFRKDCQVTNKLLCSGSVKDIFLVSSCVESELLLQAMRSGAREFFPLPLKKEELVSAFQKFQERNKNLASADKGRTKGTIINLVGSKGGIGTTTIAVNFATSLLEQPNSRKSVVLMDMNLLFGEVPLFLDIEPVFNWGEVAKNITRLDSTYLMSILSKHPSGVHVLPSPTRLDGGIPATPDIIEKLLRFMQNEFDYIVIDSGQSLNELSLKVLELSDTVLINAILSLPCLINVRRLMDTFKRLGYPSDKNVRVIINRYHKNSVISLKEAEKGIGKRIFWQIPNDFQTTIAAINQGKTLATVAHKADITQNIRELVSLFTGMPETQKTRRGLMGWQFLEATP